MCSRHDEKLPNHTSTLTNVLLNKLSSLNSDKAAVCVMSHGPCKKGLSCAWRSIQQDSLRLRDTQAFKNLRVLNWKLNDFLYFLDLLFKSSNHVVSRIGYLLDFHQIN